jgi:AcrR family transcriptional regulator
VCTQFQERTMADHAEPTELHYGLTDDCPERGKHDKEARQRALMQAATAVFAEHGYDAATTREVAERANCSEGLIHRYFHGKRGLLLAVLNEKAAEFGSRMQSEQPDRETLQEELDQIFLWPLQKMWEERDFMRVSVSRASIDPEVGHVVGHHLNQQRVDVIADKLRRHQEAGRVRADVDIEAIALAISGINLTSAFFSQVVFNMDRERVREMTLHAARIIARGLEPERDEHTGFRRNDADRGRSGDTNEGSRSVHSRFH